MFYQKLHLISHGTYGNVYICKYNDMLKATKIVEFKTNDKLSLRSIIRETFMLKNVKHPNLISTKYIFITESTRKYTKYIHYIMDIYSHNLAIQMELWRKSSKNNFNLIKYVLKQILEGIHYLHNNNILHRDIKPENILVDSNLSIKIIDYGLCKLNLSKEEEKVEKSEYVQTLWYRAPEVFLLEFCNDKSDMWSIGCIMFELLTYRTNVLFAYDSAKEVICAILKTFRKSNISEDILNFYELDKDLILSNNDKFNLDIRIAKYNRLENSNYIDLMKNILRFNANERFSAKQCLQHKLFTNINPIVNNIKINDEIKQIDSHNFENFDYDLLNILNNLVLNS